MDPSSPCPHSSLVKIPHADTGHDGGDKIVLPGNISLCGRDDLEPARTFAGSISQLMLFDDGALGRHRDGHEGTSQSGSAGSMRAKILEHFHPWYIR